MSSAMTNFRGEDMPGQISHAKDSPKSKSKAKAKEKPAEATSTSEPTTTSESQTQAESTPESQAESDSGEDPPAGTTTEILHWVQGDETRAQAALDAEEGNERPRVGLVTELKRILSGE